jgi:very-short-patch-repair endonuclease
LLKVLGWTVLRFWETDILRDTIEIADIVVSTLALSHLRAVFDCQCAPRTKSCR